MLRKRAHVREGWVAYQNKEQRPAKLCHAQSREVLLTVFSVLPGPPPDPLAARAGLFCNCLFYFLLFSPSSLGPRDVQPYLQSKQIAFHKIQARCPAGEQIT